MPVLTFMAWAAFGVAGIIVLAAAILEDFWLVPTAFIPAIAGVLFMALERIVVAVEAIRQQIAPIPVPEFKGGSHVSVSQGAEIDDGQARRTLASRFSRRGALARAARSAGDPPSGVVLADDPAPKPDS